MKNFIISNLFFLIAVTVAAQYPPSVPAKDPTPSYSNNQVQTEYDMVVTNTYKPIENVLPDKDAILVYDYDGTIKSYNLATNRINWEVKARGEEVKHGWNRFTLENGVLYVPFLNGEMMALNHKTGEKFWELKMGIKNSQYVKSTVNQYPRIHNNHLFVTTQYENSNIYAFDKRTGDIIWNYKLDYPYNHLPVLVFDEKVFTQNAPYVYNFEAETGRALYQRGFDQAMYGKPVTDGHSVIISNEGQTVYSLAPDNLDILWEFNTEEDHYNIDEKILVKDGTVYFVTESNSDTGGVYALDSKTGKQLWKTILPGDMEELTALNGKLYVLSDKGIFYRIDARTGNDELTLPLNNLPISNFEFVDENTLYYYCEAGLVKLNLKTEKEENVYIRNVIDDEADRSYILLVK